MIGKPIDQSISIKKNWLIGIVLNSTSKQTSRALADRSSAIFRELWGQKLVKQFQFLASQRKGYTHVLEESR